LAKRYLLLQGESSLSSLEAKELEEALQKDPGGIKMIGLPDNDKAFVLKTSGETVMKLRRSKWVASINGKTFVPVLTSGAIGKLKKKLREEKGAP